MLAAYARIDDRVRVLGYAVKHFAKVSSYFILVRNLSYVHSVVCIPVETTYQF